MPLLPLASSMSYIPAPPFSTRRSRSFTRTSLPVPAQSECGSLRSSGQKKSLKWPLIGTEPQQLLNRRRRHLLKTVGALHDLRKRCQILTGALIRPIDKTLLRPRDTSQAPARLRRKSKSKSEGVKFELGRYMLVRMCRDIKIRGLQMSEEEWGQLCRVRTKIEQLRDKFGLDKEMKSDGWRIDWEKSEELRSKAKRQLRQNVKVATVGEHSSGSRTYNNAGTQVETRQRFEDRAASPTIADRPGVVSLHDDVDNIINKGISPTYQFTFSFPTPLSRTMKDFKENKENIDPRIFGRDRHATRHNDANTKNWLTGNTCSEALSKFSSRSGHLGFLKGEKDNTWHRTPLAQVSSSRDNRLTTANDG